MNVAQEEQYLAAEHERAPEDDREQKTAMAAGASRVRHSAGTLATISAGHGERTANAASAATNITRQPAMI